MSEVKPKRIRTTAVIQTKVDAFTAGLRNSLLKLSNLTLDAYRADESELTPVGGKTSSRIAAVLLAIEEVQGTALALATTHDILLALDAAKEQVKSESPQPELFDRGNGEQATSQDRP